MLISVEKIKMAHQNGKAHYRKTPLLRCHSFERLFNSKHPVYLKAENLQYTGSFKLRGALTKLLSILPEAKEKGVVAASAGNHAQGVAFHGQHLGVSAKIVMPIGTPFVKKQATQNLGAEVILFGESYNEAFQKAKEIEAQEGRIYVHAFDDEAIIAGQASIAVEVLEDLPEIQTFVCPIGGGGLMAGCSSYFKQTKPDVNCVAVQAKGCSTFLASLKAGKPVGIERVDTMAEGMAVKKMGEQTFSICKETVSDTVEVGEEEIAEGVLFALERERLFVEGCGGAVLAAAIQQPELLEGPSVLLLSGGNLDVNLLNRIIDRGLVRSGRRIRIEAELPDIPGSLEKLIHVIAGQKASIVNVEHERVFTDLSVKEVHTSIELETEGRAHIQALKKAFERAKIPGRFVG